MSNTTTDLIPSNLLARLKSLEQRTTVLEKLVRRGVDGDVADLLLREIGTGDLYRLECEYVNGEVSLFLVPVAEK